MSREYNRRQHSKALQKARTLATRLVRFTPNPAGVVEKMAHRLRDNRTPCSCDMCCNPRRSKSIHGRDKLTLQERKVLDNFYGEQQ